jgi:protein SEY1
MAAAVDASTPIRRPSMPVSLGSAPSKIMGPNGHKSAHKPDFTNGIQVVDSDGSFGDKLLAPYLQHEGVLPAGFNYHLVSVFGSQSTGKSTLLNSLFGTGFGVMDEADRRQTTKGIWLAKNKRAAAAAEGGMAENILVMDVEGTDGQERGEDQDFERKSALFALATSEILLVNMWETQVGLYHGANMGLLKTVFEVNLQLFVKDTKSIPRSLLLFVIRDHTGRTPLVNLRNSLINNLTRIWSSISKPTGLEDSRIEDYFDFAFAALPHKLLQPELFEKEVAKLGTRFRMGYKDRKKIGLLDEDQQPLLLPDYHRRIPADGFAVYANGVWEQIMSNKDLDLPTQQELLAQFRCLEISRECMVAFDEVVAPLEADQADAVKDGQPDIIKNLGEKLTTSREKLLEDFEGAASRYHKGVYQKQKEELMTTVDGRLKILFDGQLAAAHKLGLIAFDTAVSHSVKDGAKSGAQYDFAEIVETERTKAITQFEEVAKQSAVAGTPWSEYAPQLRLFHRELEKESKRLRQDEMRLLATRIERWIKSHIDESIGLEFNKLGSGRGGSRAPESGSKPKTENDHWDRVWSIFTETVSQGENRFIDRAKSFDASNEEVEVGLWRLRRKSWTILKTKINDELAESNLGMKLREK